MRGSDPSRQVTACLGQASLREASQGVHQQEARASSAPRHATVGRRCPRWHLSCCAKCPPTVAACLLGAGACGGFSVCFLLRPWLHEPACPRGFCFCFSEVLGARDLFFGASASLDLTRTDVCTHARFLFCVCLLLRGTLLTVLKARACVSSPGETAGRCPPGSFLAPWGRPARSQKCPSVCHVSVPLP